MKHVDPNFLKNADRQIPLREELKPRTVETPDGQVIEIDPITDYFCEAAPKVHPKAYFKIVEDFYNWARAESLWILGFGTGCGAIEMRPPDDAAFRRLSLRHPVAADPAPGEPADDLRLSVGEDAEACHPLL